MSLHLYYKEGALTKWRKVPIDFSNHEEATDYYNKHFKGSKHKILFEEEEKTIAEKKEHRKETVKKAGRLVKRGALATHERLKVAGHRDYERIKEELGEEPRQRPTSTAYDKRLRELQEERRIKERELKVEDLRRLAEKRAEEKYKQETRRAQAGVKKTAWHPPNVSVFGEGDFDFTPPAGAFETHQKRAEQYRTKGPGFKQPFEEVNFNPNANPWGFEFGRKPTKKKGRK